MKYEETVKKLEERDKKLIYFSKIIEDKNKDVQQKQTLEKERETLIADRDQRISKEEDLRQTLHQKALKISELEAELREMLHRNNEIELSKKEQVSIDHKEVWNIIIHPFINQHEIFSI